MSEHFPTPWHVDKYAMSIYAADVPQGSPRVADLRGWGYLTGKGHGALGLSDDDGVKAQRANAELIVKAVNNHDALVKALTDIAAMDPKGIRADDLGRAARVATDVLARVGRMRNPQEGTDGIG